MGRQFTNLERSDLLGKSSREVGGEEGVPVFETL